ncbi:MAG: YdeI/OmpD-associated family protein [Opitutaceae bacterium]|nr:YdeI/OmpD-associated family protein [Opitutaceae bacterium]
MDRVRSGQCVRRTLRLTPGKFRRAGLDAGAAVEVALERTSTSHKVPLPADLRRALQFRPTAAAALERASPSTWRMVIELLEQARTPETRQRRLENMVERMAENAPKRATKA